MSPYNTSALDGTKGVTTCALERRAMLVGASATQQCEFTPDAFSLLPADVDGPTPPPDGAPNYLLAERRTVSDKLDMYRFAVDWDQPENTVFSEAIEIAVEPYVPACMSEVRRGRCVPQPDTSIKLESLGQRLMYRLAYRNFGTHESLVANHSVATDGNPGQTAQIGVGWYEIRDPGADVPVVYQEGVAASPIPDQFRWMASIAMDRQGNIAMGYSSSSTSLYPSINYTGRLASDPLGTTPFEEGLIMAGTGSQTGIAARWGDYTSMNVDPLDDCTFWHANEYLETTSLNGWSTQIAAFKFPGCTGSTTLSSAPGAVSADPGLGSVSVSWTSPTDDGGLPIVGYSVVASPGGATCSTVVGATADPLACAITGLDPMTAYTFEVRATNARGSGPGSTSAAVAPGSALVPLNPVRIADTRVGQPVAFPETKAPVAAGTTLQVPVAGQFGVPADANAVSVNVTAVGPTDPGYITVFPCGSPRPLASNLNFTAGQTVPNSVISGVGTGGSICVYTTATVNVVVDLNGWLPRAAGFTPVAPVRVADTRPPSQQPTIPAGGTLRVPVAGAFGVPANASALALNVTAVGADGPGFMTVYPCGATRPNASNLNYIAGQSVPNAVVSRVGDSGAVCVYSSQRANVLVDLDGWFAPTPGFTGLDPLRVADTRAGEPVAFPWPKAQLKAGTVLAVPVSGQLAAPGQVGAVALNVTVISPTAAGFLTVYPCGSERPNASNLNYAAGQIVPNQVLTAVGEGGKVCVYSQQDTELAIDLSGWFPRV